MLTEQMYTARDGVNLHVLGLLPDSPKSIILFIHGLGDHIGRYEHWFDAWHRQEVGCLGFDLRGHGKSEGQRGHSPSYEHLLDDIGEILQWVYQSYQDIPIFLYGHSMGGNLGFNFLLRRQPETVMGGIITSPWLELTISPGKFNILLASLMTKIYPAWSEKNGLDADQLSRDSEVGRLYEEDPLVHERISAGLFHSVSQAGTYAIRHAGDLTTPVLLIHGEADPITSHNASATVAAANPEYIDFRSFPGMLHETHNETGKEKVFETQLNWVTRFL